MLTAIHPKLPMRDKTITRDYYIHQLGFEQSGGDYDEYLMLRMVGIVIKHERVRWGEISIEIPVARS